MTQTPQAFLEQAGHNRRVAEALPRGNPPFSLRRAVH